MPAIALRTAAVAVLLLATRLAAAQEVPTASAAPRRAATPNGALSFELPEGWVAKPLKTGTAVEPPGNPLDETFLVACEPWVAKKDQKDPYGEMFERLRAGQLATVEESPRPTRESFTTVSGPGVEITYKGTDDGGKPAALCIFLVPCDGRVAILTGRLPWKRLSQRWKPINDLVGSFKPMPAAEEKALARRLVGRWRSDAAPLVALKFLANGTFEEQREAGKTTPVSSRASQTKVGAFEVIGREVRLRFDDGEARSFRIDADQATEFTSAGQKWSRIGE